MSTPVQDSSDAGGAATDTLIDASALTAALNDPGTAIVTFKEALLGANAKLAERFRENEPIDRLVHQQALCDEVFAAADASACSNASSASSSLPSASSTTPLFTSA